MNRSRIPDKKLLTTQTIAKPIVHRVSLRAH